MRLFTGLNEQFQCLGSCRICQFFQFLKRSDGILYVLLRNTDQYQFFCFFLGFYHFVLNSTSASSTASASFKFPLFTA